MPLLAIGGNPANPGRPIRYYDFSGMAYLCHSGAGVPGLCSNAKSNFKPKPMNSMLRKTSSLAVLSLVFCLGSILLTPGVARANYAEFPDVGNAGGADIVVQELRWPYWNGGYYNTWTDSYLEGSDGVNDQFYSGVPQPASGSPTQAAINYSFWSLGNPLHPTDTISSKYSSPTTFPRQTIAEGTVLEDPGTWYFWQTNTWYRVAFRTWQPADGTPHLGYAGEWIRDGASGIWYHTATAQLPFAVTSVNGWSGFQENIGGGSSQPQRTDFRRLYYHHNGVWNSGINFHDYNQNGTNGESGPGYGMVDNAGLITNSIDGTNAAVYLETCAKNPSYVGTITNQGNGPSYVISQPATPTFLDPILVTNYGGSVNSGQLLVQWQLPNTSSPQFAYQINVYTNAGYTGTVVATAYDNDPETRQKLLSIPAGITPYPQLTIVDIFNQTNAPVNITVTNATLLAATNVSGLAGGLNFAYYESASNIQLATSGTNWATMPNFATLTPVLQGAVSGLDVTPRRRRDGYAFNYTGYISVPSNGLYTFTLNSCDGSILYVDGQQVVNWDGDHSPSDMSGWVGLQAGYHTLNVQFFCDTQPYSGYYFDAVSLSYEGPGITRTAVPVTAYARVSGASEPSLSLTSPANGVTVSGASVPLSAAVTTNGNTINSVWFYNGNNFLAQDTTAPYTNNAFFWDSNNNPLRARLYYNGTNIIDSAVNVVNTTNQTLIPWQFGQVFFHDYPSGASSQDGTYSLIGDGVDLLTRQVSGDCTIIAHLAGLPGTAAAPDGSVAESGWQAGIILRGTTNLVQGYPWGKSGSAPFVAVFGEVGGGTYYQDEDMVNGGGGFNRGVTAGNWYKLVRTGGTNFTSFVSADGSTWTQVGNTNLTDFPTTIYAGMFTYAEPDGNLSVPWAKFDNVSITGYLVGPPTVIVTPSSATANTGQSTTLTAMPSGNAPFYYQWQLNGVNLAGATNATLALTNVQPANSGSYNVVLTNADGTASAAATLSVQTVSPVTTQTLSPLADAYVRDGSYAGNNYGTDPSLTVKLDGTSYQRESFLKFGVSALTNAQSVQVQLVPVMVNTGSRTLSFEFVSDDTWTESGITWNNKPATTGLVFTNLSQFTVNTPVVVDVTAQAQAQAAGDGQLSLWIHSTTAGSTTDLSFASKENSNVSAQPQLIYTLKSPAVILTSPASGAGFGSPGTINLSASFTNITGHVINYVQFYTGTNLLGQANSAPYNGSWTNVPSGSFTVYAQAVYDGTNTISSAPAFITVYPLPPAPATITPVALSGNVISITWSGVTNATGYVLSRNGTAIATVGSTSYLDTGLTVNTAYAYSVVATNLYGNSPPSVTNTVTTAASGAARWWDAGGVTAGAQDGNGNWGASSVTWWDGAENVAWTDGNLAIMGNGTMTNCVVTITNNITPGGILFNTNSGGTYSLAGGGQVILAGTPAITCNDSAVIGTVLLGGGGLSKTGPGTLTLTATNTYTGATAIGGGTLAITGSGRLGNGSYAGTIADNGALNYGGTAAQTLSGVLSGGGALTASGSGSLTLSGANNYAGGTTVIPAGDITGLVVANATALGTGALFVKGGDHYSASVNVNGGLTVTNAATLQRGNSGTGNASIGVGTATASASWSGPIIVDNTAGTGFGGVIFAGNSAANAGIVSGSIGYSTLGVVNPSFVMRGGNYGKLTGPVSLANGYVQLLDATKVEFSSTANAWGTLDLANAGAVVYVGAGNALATNGVAYSNVGGTVQLNNLAGTTAYNQTVAGLSGNVKVALATGSATLTLNVPANQNSTGVISGAVSLIKTGTAVQTLSATNTSTGTTTVSGGTLQVNGSTGTGAVTVQNTATLAGTGLVKGTATVQTGGALAPGNNGIGTLAFGGGLTLNAGSQTVMELGKNGGVLASDLVAVTGALSLNGTLTAVNVGSNALAAGDSFTLFTAGTFSGNFATLNLPPLSPGLVWNTSSLAVNGTLAVAANAAAPLIWSGAVNGVWDIGLTTNWSNGSTGAVFTNNANVQFDDTATGTTAVTLNTVVSPAGVTFANSSLNYSISGSGSIGGITTLVKSGTGTVTLATANGYTGQTVVNGGTLQVNGSLAAGVVTVATNALLMGNGTINGPTTIQSGGTLQPGLGGSNTGTMTISNSLNLAGNVVFALNKTNAQTASKIGGLGTVTYGGTLTVTNLGGTLALGDTFTLFQATNCSGSFANLVLPPLAAGLTWNMAGLASGTIAVSNQPLVQNGGFEAGSFANWTSSGDTTQSSVTTNTSYVHSGNDGAQIGPYNSNLAFISQTLTTVPGQAYVLSFWLKDTYAGSTGSPTIFQANWNANTICAITNGASSASWSNLTFVVTATNGSTVLQFGFYNSPGWFGFDDVSVTATNDILNYLPGTNGAISGATPQVVSYTGSGSAVTAVPNAGWQFVNWSDGSTANPRTDMNVTSNLTVTANFAVLITPAVTSLSLGAGGTAVTLTGTGAANQNYVLLTATNLPAAAWTPVQTNLTGSDGVFHFTDAPATNYSQRFYRIQSQ